MKACCRRRGFLYFYTYPEKKFNMKTRFLLIVTAAMIVTSCGKKSTTPATPATQESYLNTSGGSSWTYQQNDSSGATPTSSQYTLTSTSKDSTIGNKSYHVYNYSYGGNQYLNLTGSDYFQFDSLPGGLGQVFERLYLKDNLANGGTWSQDVNVNISLSGIPLSVKITLNNKIAEKAISRQVNGNSYADVIHVSTSLSSSSIPASGLTSSIDSYYAPKYGLIENRSVINLDYLTITQKVNFSTKLLNAALK
jgi:hypothetical protein